MILGLTRPIHTQLRSFTLAILHWSREMHVWVWIPISSIWLWFDYIYSHVTHKDIQYKHLHYKLYKTYTYTYVKHKVLKLQQPTRYLLVLKMWPLPFFPFLSARHISIAAPAIAQCAPPCRVPIIGKSRWNWCALDFRILSNEMGSHFGRDQTWCLYGSFEGFPLKK